MWISKVTIENFRKATAFMPIEVELNDGLNLLVGENNVGKTCVAEALALALGYGNSDRNVFLKEQDFNDPAKPIKISIMFDGLSTDQEAAFLQALVIEKYSESEEESGTGEVVRANFQFLFELNNRKISNRVLCGENFEVSAPMDLIGNLKVTYLPALRDANQEFKPGYKSRIGKILKSRFAGGDQEVIEQIFERANIEALAHQGTANPVSALAKKANTSIEKLSLYGTNNKIKMEFVEQEFNRIIANISMKTDAGLDIETNGLGYNNLIYIATIITELEHDHKEEPHSYNCLLIEEPEAHLHPQLQTLLLDFVQSNYPEIQVILTSHSPTLVAETEFKNLSVMSTTPTGVVSRRVANSSISGDHEIFLQRFLDVTKSQLFFARNIIFVEGITEALLLKLFWDLYYTLDDEKFSRQGIEIVNINGVAFSPYAGLVKGIFAKSNIKCTILTDDDRGSGIACPVNSRFKDGDSIKNTEVIETIFANSPLSSRAKKLSDEVKEIQNEGFNNLSIFLARKTFEVEFALANIENKTMLEDLAGMTRGSLVGMSEIGAAVEFWKQIVEKDIKTEVSTMIAKKILNKETVSCPQHFINAFEFIRPKKKQSQNGTN